MKLSVWMICYNQEKFIHKAVQSAINQKTNFDFEIVIGDDFSRDKTRAILLGLKKKYPQKIKLVLNKKNIGIVKNQLNVLRYCQGKYIAMLEGDDYWLDRNKLQKQVDFLENNENFTITSHNVLLKDEPAGKFIGESMGGGDKDLDLRYLLKFGSGGATCSLVYLKDALSPIPEWFENLPSSDWITQILCATKGEMHYFGRAMAVYRRNTGGATTFTKGSDKELRAFTVGGEDLCTLLNKYFKFKYNREISVNLTTYFYPQIMNVYLNRGDRLMAAKYFSKMIFGMVKYQTIPANFHQIVWRLIF